MTPPQPVPAAKTTFGPQTCELMCELGHPGPILVPAKHGKTFQELIAMTTGKNKSFLQQIASMVEEIQQEQAQEQAQIVAAAQAAGPQKAEECYLPAEKAKEIYGKPPGPSDEDSQLANFFQALGLAPEQLKELAKQQLMQKQQLSAQTAFHPLGIDFAEEQKWHKQPASPAAQLAQKAQQQKLVAENHKQAKQFEGYLLGVFANFLGQKLDQEMIRKLAQALADLLYPAPELPMLPPGLKYEAGGATQGQKYGGVFPDETVGQPFPAVEPEPLPEPGITPVEVRPLDGTGLVAPTPNYAGMGMAIGDGSGLAKADFK